MRKIANRFLSLALAALVLGPATLTSCNNEETYAEQKERERDVINRYIASAGIKVITEREFEERGYTTDVSANEYVLFSKSGVYMQIINKGCGEKVKDGETVHIFCRFTEYNLNDPYTVSLTNEGENYLATFYDELTVSNTSGTFTASYVTTNSTPIMVDRYSSTSVPSGWLIPLSYINIGRPANEGENIAKIQLIVPHTQGHKMASAQVNAYRYILTYERGN